MPKSYEYLWVRLGDQGDYEEYGHDLSAVAGLLLEAGVRKIWRATSIYAHSAVEAEGFEGYNYISLYWGDVNGAPLRPITKREFDQINRWLAHPGKYAFMGDLGETEKALWIATVRDARFVPLDDLEQVAHWLYSQYDVRKIWRSEETGAVEAEGFEGPNFITLYWGILPGGTFIKNITKREIDSINRWLAHPEKFM